MSVVIAAGNLTTIPTKEVRTTRTRPGGSRIRTNAARSDSSGGNSGDRFDDPKKAHSTQRYVGLC